MAQGGEWPSEDQANTIMEMLSREQTVDRFRFAKTFTQKTNIDEIQQKLEKTEDSLTKLVSVVGTLNLKHHQLQNDMQYQMKEVTDLYDQINKRNLIFIF